MIQLEALGGKDSLKFEPMVKPFDQIDGLAFAIQGYLILVPHLVGEGRFLLSLVQWLSLPIHIESTYLKKEAISGPKSSSHSRQSTCTFSWMIVSQTVVTMSRGM
jgi:hypothetical protein